MLMSIISSQSSTRRSSSGEIGITPAFAEENVKLAVSLTGQLDEVGYVARRFTSVRA